MPNEQDIVTVAYRCRDPHCYAEDRATFFRYERIAHAINCWRCHGGRGLDVESMLDRNVGMHLMDPSVVIGNGGEDPRQPPKTTTH